MREVFESEAIEVEDAAAAGEADAEEARRLPVRASGGDVALLSDEVKTVALAAAGGIVAGAATAAVVRATRAVTAPKKRSRRVLRRGERPQEVVASRSFIVDIHLLGQK